MKASDNVFPKVLFDEVAAPATPAADTVIVYAKSDGLLYSKDDAGVETALSGGGGGGGAVDSVVAGAGIDVDAADPANPIVDLDAASLASLALADSSVQPGDNISTLTNNSGYTTNTGTVTSVNLADSTGLTASGGPVVGAGSLTYTLSANLQAWHGLATSAKEDALAAGTAAQFYRGDKTWSNSLVGPLLVTDAISSGGTNLLATGLYDAAEGGLYVQVEGTAARTVMYSAGAVQSQLIGGRASGTLASPTATAMGDVLDLYASTYTGAGWAYPSYIKFSAVEAQTASAQGMEIAFGTTMIGSAVPSNRFILTHDGHWVPVAANTSDIASTGSPLRAGYVTTPAVQDNSTKFASTAYVDRAAVIPLIVAVGDETTAITTGTNKVRFRMPFAGTLIDVRASCNTAPTGSTIIIDINESGTTVLSTKLSIDASETTSTTAASAAVISDSALADDAEMSIDFDQVGSTVAGAGVKVTLLIRKAA